MSTWSTSAEIQSTIRFTQSILCSRVRTESHHQSFSAILSCWLAKGWLSENRL